jgi:zinc transport system substrate-binding protein
MRHLIRIGGCALLLTLPACSPDDRQDLESTAQQTSVPQAPLRVLTVNDPLAYFAGRIGGPEVDARYPGPADEDPAYWRPTPEQIAEFQAADLVLLNGAGYAGWTERASLAPSRLVNTSGVVAERYIREEETVVHAHGPEGEHEHGKLAFTTWLDPTMALAQARAIRDALAARRPEASAGFEARFEALEVDLLDLDAALARAAEDLAGRPILGSHPVYQYLAARYGLDLRSVHFEPDEVPAAGAWAELERLQAERPATIMLWEAEPLPEVVGRLQSEHGIRSIVFSPCANGCDADDYMVMMRENAQRLSSLAD